MKGLLGRVAMAGLSVSLLALGLGDLALTTVKAAPVGNAYVSLSPVRLLDTRTNGETLGPRASLTLPVAGVGAVPATATAVAVNVTVTDTTAPSFLTVYPTGETLPGSSNLNWSAGATVANLAIEPVGANGDLTFYNAAGSADVTVDLQGYFVASSSAGGDYLPLPPQRISDTRTGSGYPNAGQTLGTASSLNIQVAGQGGVPLSGVSAVVLNVTVTNTTEPSFLAVYPGSQSVPGTSSVNWSAGATVANRVVVPLSSAGQITLFNDLGRADVVIDVSGYFTAGASSLAAASLYYPMAPIRVLDTRLAADQPAASSSLGEQFAGVDGIGTQATAIVANLTSTDTSAASYYSLSPSQTPPPTSDLNWVPGATVANLAFTALNAGGDAYLYNSQGRADAVIDVFGYFVPVGASNASAALPCSGATISSSLPTYTGGPIDVSVQASCPTGAAVQYTFWERAPGTSVWSLAAAGSTSSTFQYSTTSWGNGSYQLMAWASSQLGIYQGAFGGSTVTNSANPSVNLPDTFMDTCYTYGFASTSCGTAEIAAINSARSGEGLPPLVWPTSLFSLNEAEQVFIVANEERISRGLPPIAGLTAAANQSATLAAQANQDPNGSTVSGEIAYSTNWAVDYGGLGAMFDWMYNDGPGSFNMDCPTIGSWGCWVHRDDILLNTVSGAFATQPGYSWVGGTACVPESGSSYPSYLNSCTLLWVEVPTPTSYAFTWADALTLGA